MKRLACLFPCVIAGLPCLCDAMPVHAYIVCGEGGRPMAATPLAVSNYVNRLNFVFSQVAVDFELVRCGVLTNENWLTIFVVFLDLFSDSFEFCGFGSVDEIVFIDAGDWFVRRDLNDIEGVNLLEFFGFGKSSTGHTCLLVKLVEEVLECNCSKSLRLSLNLNMFLCFNSLMKTI